MPGCEHARSTAALAAAALAAGCWPAARRRPEPRQCTDPPPHAAVAAPHLALAGQPAAPPRARHPLLGTRAAALARHAGAARATGRATARSGRRRPSCATAGSRCPTSCRCCPVRGFASRVARRHRPACSPARPGGPGCPVGRRRPGLGPADVLGLRRPAAHRRAARRTRVADDLVVRSSGGSTRRGSRSRRCGSRTPADLDAPPTGDGNDTEVFVCRPTTGGTSYSQHAYGLAIDVNTLPEPLRQGRPGDPGARLRLPRPRRGSGPA